MARQTPSRRRLLRAGSVVGVGGLAGCLGSLFGGSDYSCTQLAEEPTEEVPTDATPLPFAFERPTVMEQTESYQGDDGGGTVEYAKTWKQFDDSAGEGGLNHRLSLELKYFVYGGGEARPPVRGGTVDTRAVGKREVDGEVVGVFGTDDRETRLTLFLPNTVDGERVYDSLEIVSEASLQGDQDARDRARGDESERTCEAVMASVAMTALDSIDAISPAETETTASLSPTSATVARGDSVTLTAAAGGVDWVDLQVDTAGEREGFSFSGSVAVPDGEFPITITPPSDDRGADVISTPEDVRLHTVNSIGPFAAGKYTVELAGVGSDGFVTATTELTVESG